MTPWRALAGIVFNNTVTGTTDNGHEFTLRNERASRSFPVFGKCDGTSPFDGNQIPAGQGIENESDIFTTPAAGLSIVPSLPAERLDATN